MTKRIGRGRSDLSVPTQASDKSVTHTGRPFAMPETKQNDRLTYRLSNRRPTTAGPRWSL